MDFTEKVSERKICGSPHNVLMRMVLNDSKGNSQVESPLRNDGETLQRPWVTQSHKKSNAVLP